MLGLLQDIKVFIETDPYFKAGLISSGVGSRATYFHQAAAFCSKCFSMLMLSTLLTNTVLCRSIKPYNVVVNALEK